MSWESRRFINQLALNGKTWIYLKSDSHPPKKICVICFNDTTLKMVKNAFYSILKALFDLMIFKFLSWIFGHVEKTA